MLELTRANLLERLNAVDKNSLSDSERALHEAKITVITAMSPKSLTLKGEYVLNSKNLHQLSIVAARRRTGSGGTRSLKALARFVTQNKKAFQNELKENIQDGERITQRGLRYLGINGKYKRNISSQEHKYMERFFASKQWFTNNTDDIERLKKEIKDDLDPHSYAQRAVKNGDRVIGGKNDPLGTALTASNETIRFVALDPYGKVFYIYIPVTVNYVETEENKQVMTEHLNKEMRSNTQQLSKNADISRTRMKHNGRISGLLKNGFNNELLGKANLKSLQNIVSTVSDPSIREKVSKDISFVFNQGMLVCPCSYINKKGKLSTPFFMSGDGLLIDINTETENGTLKSVEFIIKSRDRRSGASLDLQHIDASIYLEGKSAALESKLEPHTYNNNKYKARGGQSITIKYYPPTAEGTDSRVDVTDFRSHYRIEEMTAEELDAIKKGVFNEIKERDRQHYDDIYINSDHDNEIEESKHDPVLPETLTSTSGSASTKGSANSKESIPTKGSLGDIKNDV